MIIGNQNAIQPKDGRTLKVIRIARISTTNQDERSLDDQLALLQQQVEAMHNGPVKYFDLATQGSGEKLDREELQKLEEMIESGEYDLVIAEDLARICRRLHAITICELCEDFDTRLIAINDRVDTSDERWRDGAFISSWHHERSNKDTSDRIKRSLRNRFINRAILADPGPFYFVPDDAKTIDDVVKHPDAVEVVETGIQMLEKECYYSEVADWLNDIGFLVGGQSKQSRWNGKLVKERFLDTRLKGIEEWNTNKSVRDNKSGRRKSKKSDPDEILTREVPHMAFLEPVRYERLKTMLERKNSRNHRSGDPSSDPLLHRPKKRTPFPGQSMFCGICGRKLVFGGHGQKHHLMCDGARQYQCWNGATVDGRLAAHKIAEAILSEYEMLPEFDQSFLSLINEEADRADETRQSEAKKVQMEIRKCEHEIENYISFIAEGQSSAVRKRLIDAEEKLVDLQSRLHDLQNLPCERIEIPTSGQLRLHAREVLQGTLPFTWEFNKIIRHLVPRIVVFPHRLIDGGHIELRCKFRLHLGSVCQDQQTREALREPLERTLCVDLFNPPQREEFRMEVMRLRETGKEREIADRLGITVTAAQRAAKLQRMMNEIGVTDPYQPVTEPPTDYTKLRRHLHKRFDFQPLPDAGQF